MVITCMDSGTLEDSYEDLNSRGRCRWTENRIVYTRRAKRKARKDNNDIATTTSSVADNLAPAALPTSDVNPTPSATEASSATVATAGVTEVSTVSVPEKVDSCATGSASPPPTVNDGFAATTSPDRTSGGRVEPEPPEGVVTKDVDSHQTLQENSPHRNKSHGSPDKGVDSFGQQVLQEREQPQEQVQLALEDENSNKNQIHEGCVSQPVEELSFPDGSEAHNLEKSLVVDGTNEALHVSDDRIPSLEGRSPLLCKNDPPNGQEDAALVHYDRSDEQNELVPGSPQVLQGNCPVTANRLVKLLVKSGIGDKIRIKICKSIPKNDIKELRKKLELELDCVRKLVQQFESKELQIASYNTQIMSSNLGTNSDYINPESANVGQPQPLCRQIDGVDRRVLVRMHSEMSAMGNQEARSAGLVRVNSDMGTARNLGCKPYGRKLSIAVMENNNLISGFNEKEKRTPKANKYYRNSEFLLGKDRLPAESNKRFKANNGRKHGRETGRAFGFGIDKNSNRVFKSCSSLLQRLMKHKYGWVFNEPVDAKALGLIDYHDIIKHPMDLGTVKARLLQNTYRSPTQFAEDVRLVFRNAMTYNPKGQDVHVMAEQLLQVFEERWAIIETEYNACWKYQMYQDGGLATPSRKALSQSHWFGNSVPVSASIPGFIPAAVHAPVYVPTPSTVPLYAPAASLMRPSERLEPMAMTLSVNPKIHRPYVGRTPIPKKPKAKDPDKRDMTYDEKRRLSNHLQGLPTEKLDTVIQIIKKRNTTLSQHDDEIEVDIDSVDTETLWELDRFVTNYKKSLSKNKRKAELLQARMAANQKDVTMNTTTPSAVADANTKYGAAFEKRTAAPPEGEKQEDDRSRTSSSNSSSSDSGSSSSDSDSDSSSADGSDAEHSGRA